MDQCTINSISPDILSQKYKINKQTLYGWFRKVGITLPKKYPTDIGPSDERWLLVNYAIENLPNLKECPMCNFQCHLKLFDLHIRRYHQPILGLKKLQMTPAKCKICEKFLGYTSGHGKQHKTLANKIVESHVAKYHLPTVKLMRLEKQISSKLNVKSDKNEGFDINSKENQVDKENETQQGQKESEIQRNNEENHEGVADLQNSTTPLTEIIPFDTIKDNAEETVPDIESINNEQVQEVKMEHVEDFSTFELMPF